MIRQKYTVMLSENSVTGVQVWLGYNDLGRIGNANYEQAYRYESVLQATIALRAVRKIRAWPNAKIMGTTVETLETTA